MNGRGIEGVFEGEIEGDSLNNWERATILDVSEQIRGVTYSKSDACDISKDGYLPILRANNIQNDKLKFSDLVYVPETCVSKQQLLQPNDVVLAMSSGSASVVGKTAQIRHVWNGAFGAFCGVLRPSPHIEPRYFGLFLRSEEYRNKVSALSKGININNLKREHFQQIEMPVAPLNEQNRIADKLDQTLAIVEQAKVRLARVPEILKQFRQGVLAAATDGRLTEEWRIEKGLPQWERVGFGDVIDDKPKNGYSARPVQYETPWRVLTLTATTSGKFDGKYYKYFDEEVQATSTFWCKPGDILIQRGNTIEYVGVSAIYSGEPQTYIYPDLMIRVRASKRIITEFLLYCLSSEYIREFMRSRATGTAGNMPKINQQVLMDIKLDIPSLEEQTEIIRRVETLLALADRIEARYKAITQQVDKLTQSLLAKAFRGELVPQDPSDEPAAVLLERIRATRETNPKRTTNRKLRKERVGDTV